MTTIFTGLAFPRRQDALSMVESRLEESVEYRPLDERDDLHAVTTMLHAAYRPLAEAGMRFVASHQDVSMTRKRVQRGETFVAAFAGRIIGIITWRCPSANQDCEYYGRAEVATFGQFAVDPEFQGQGIGSQLLRIVEARVREEGFAQLALDTSEHAQRLIDMYEAMGFRMVESVRWPEVNYKSVILAKQLRDRS